MILIADSGSTKTEWLLVGKQGIERTFRTSGINPYFLKDYAEGAKRYNAMKCANIISWLREYDLKSKGVGNANISDGELLKELIFKIMH